MTAGAFRVEQNEVALRKAIVADMVDCLKGNEPVLAIALQHRDGEAITYELRAKLKEEGLLGQPWLDVETLLPGQDWATPSKVSSDHQMVSRLNRDGYA